MRKFFSGCLMLASLCMSNAYADTVGGHAFRDSATKDASGFSDLERIVNPVSADDLFRRGEDLYRNANRVEALTFFRQAAEQNHFLAKARLVLMDFRKTKNNTEVERECFSRLYSMAENNVDAAILLSAYYKFGCGTNKDVNKMFDVRMKLALSGNPYAQGLIGDAFRDGAGVQKDQVQAFYWYQKSAEQDNALGQYSLSLCYRYGLGTEKDESKCFYWSSRSADHGNSLGQMLLADCYRLGIGTYVDQGNAFYWYKKSAEQDNPYAEYKLGQYYYAGVGTERDMGKAVYWLRKSADNGYEQAIKFLQEIQQEK